MASVCDSLIDNKRFIDYDHVSSSEGRVCGAGREERDSAAEIIKLLITESEDRALEVLRLVREGDGPTDTLRRVKRQQKHQIAMESNSDGVSSCDEAQAPPTQKSSRTSPI